MPILLELMLNAVRLDLKERVDAPGGRDAIPEACGRG
jgi:hypothetical protein